jgi:diguanylate cyclase (GGDEF)-like protein
MLVDSMARLEHLASTDDLTGLLNRRALFEAIDLEITRARRYDSPLSLVLIDIDHFKSVNDHHGHQCGDTVLRTIGQLIGTSKRSLDIAGRYGGEELCVVLPQTSVEGAFAFAEALRQKISKLQFDGPQRGFSVTASMGIAATGATLRDATRLIALADKAMYDAKHAGRNQVVVA